MRGSHQAPLQGLQHFLLLLLSRLQLPEPLALRRHLLVEPPAAALHLGHLRLHLLQLRGVRGALQRLQLGLLVAQRALQRHPLALQLKHHPLLLPQPRPDLRQLLLHPFLLCLQPSSVYFTILQFSEASFQKLLQALLYCTAAQLRATEGQCCCGGGTTQRAVRVSARRTSSAVTRARWPSAASSCMGAAICSLSCSMRRVAFSCDCVRRATWSSTLALSSLSLSTCTPHSTVEVSIGAFRNLIIISRQDPENSAVYSEFLYLYGNHWCRHYLQIDSRITSTPLTVCSLGGVLLHYRLLPLRLTRNESPQKK